jgi:GntR family transcriptional regulator/MocR family aminotransferase
VSTKRRAIRVPELRIPLDPAAAEPLHQQVYRGVRGAILSGSLPAGAQLPSTRRLADDLAVSRTTVLVAFGQLVAEGYIVGAVGSGSYVASQIPDHLLQVGRPAPRSARVEREAIAVSRRAQAITRTPRRIPRLYPGAFWTGVPPVDEFPLRTWSRLAARRQRNLTTAQLLHTSPAGHAPLREAIVTHLASARGVRCDASQIIILCSAQEGLDVACRSLLDEGDAAWLEDPCWVGSRGALLSAGARVVPVPVDRHGLDVQKGIALAPDARLVYVSPSHQYPMGVTLTLERRLSLLDWAARTRSWIVEDDYDSEYRYTGRPITALQGLDRAGRVIYLGTFNKTIFPALRIAFLVVPPGLVETIFRVRGIGGQHVPIVDQLILTDFIMEGHFARHLRRMRAIGRERRDALLSAAARDLTGLLDVEQTETGLHTVGWLPPGVDDGAASAAADQQNVEVLPISRCYSGRCPRPGLLLGYAGLKPHEISAGVRRLAAALKTVVR